MVFKTITKYLIYKLICLYLRYSIYLFWSIEELTLHHKFHLIHKLFISALQSKALSTPETHFRCSFYLISTLSYSRLPRSIQTDYTGDLRICQSSRCSLTCKQLATTDLLSAWFLGSFLTMHFRSLMYKPGSLW